MQSIQKILVPLDFSPSSRAAIDYATLVAKAFGAAVTLMHVVEPADIMVSIVPGASVETDLIIDRRAAKGQLDELIEVLRERGDTRVDSNVVEGYASASILSYAHKGAFDLIVMGTVGRTGVRRLILGSVAEEVLRRAPCPVLTVHLPGIGG